MDHRRLLAFGLIAVMLLAAGIAIAIFRRRRRRRHHRANPPTHINTHRDRM